MTEDIPIDWNSADDILAFAIQKEQEAVEFYSDLAEHAERPEMCSVFREFADMERGHKMKLEGVKSRGGIELSAGKVQDLKIADYLVDVEPSPSMTYQQVLTVAMKREASAHKLYNDLAAATEEVEVRVMMLALAQDEARHKLRFETEYDEYVLKDN